VSILRESILYRLRATDRGPLPFYGTTHDLIRLCDLAVLPIGRMSHGRHHQREIDRLLECETDSEFDESCGRLMDGSAKISLAWNRAKSDGHEENIT
jgi:hypothetical protein